MKYDSLLKAGKIRKQKLSAEEIERAIARAERPGSKQKKSGNV